MKRNKLKPLQGVYSLGHCVCNILLVQQKYLCERTLSDSGNRQKGLNIENYMFVPGLSEMSIIVQNSGMRIRTISGMWLFGSSPPPLPWLSGKKGSSIQFIQASKLYNNPINLHKCREKRSACISHMVARGHGNMFDRVTVNITFLRMSYCVIDALVLYREAKLISLQP